MRKTLLGIFLVVFGIVAGSFVGYWLIYDGIVSILWQHQSGTFIPSQLGLAILKIISAGFIGTLVASLFLLPGVKILISYFK